MESTPIQLFYKLIVLSELITEEGTPKRWQELWNATKDQLKSNGSFINTLKELEKDGIINRKQFSRRHVEFSIVPEAKNDPDGLLALAQQINVYAPHELIRDCMEWLVSSKLFTDKKKAIKAAIDFWVLRYRNLCVRDAFNCLPLYTPQIEQTETGTQTIQNSVLIHGLPVTPCEIATSKNALIILRKLYQRREDQFFNVLLQFSEKYRTEVKQTLPLSVNPSKNQKSLRVSPSLLDFLRQYYPDASEKLHQSDEFDRFLKQIYKKEQQSIMIFCEKSKRDIYYALCDYCQYKPQHKRCKFRPLKNNILSVKEQITTKRKLMENQIQRVLTDKELS